MSQFGGGPKCPKCGKSVYFSDEVKAEGRKWHKQCFKCTKCNKSLDISNVAFYKDNPHCPPCKRELSQFDFADGGGSSDQGPSKYGAAGNACPVCGKAVYFAEEKVAAGTKFHKMCFKCQACNIMLDSSTVAVHEGHIFCKSCHKRKFGPKGYGYGGGAGTLASETVLDQPDVGGAATGPTGYASYGVHKGTTSGGGGGGGFKAGGADKCPRCGGSVYAAEKVVGAGKSWHKGCFNCSSCQKKLDSTTMCDKDGQIYCKGCYGKEFGPKGVGFGQGAGTLTTT